MDYSNGYNDGETEWESILEHATDKLERTLADLVHDIPKLVNGDNGVNYSFWYLHKMQTAHDIAKYIANEDLLGYAERFIAEVES